jgi:hypothetical protein
MEIATIVPTAYLHLTRYDNYFLALAQQVGVDRAYTQFFRERADEGKYVIMDNGAAEGTQPEWKTIIDRGLMINATELVLPDKLHDAKGTLKASAAAIQYLQEAWLMDHFKLMAVPQGRTPEEYIDCALEMLSWPIHTLGISKFMTVLLGPTARYQFLEQLNARAQENCILESRWVDVELHLLGCHISPQEIAHISSEYHIRGTDSSIAWLYASEGLHMINEDKPIKHLDLNDTSTDSYLLAFNAHIWRSGCNGEV